MLAPTVHTSPLGQRTERIFTPPFTRHDFEWMDALLQDSTINGNYAMRFIASDAIKVIITEKA